MNTFDTNSEYKKRYESMKNSDLGMFTKDYVHFQVMNFDSNVMYNVTVKGKYKKYYNCDCPDYAHHCYCNNIPCKHIIYVLDNIKRYLKLERDFRNGKLVDL